MIMGLDKAATMVLLLQLQHELCSKINHLCLGPFEDLYQIANKIEIILKHRIMSVCVIYLQFDIRLPKVIDPRRYVH